MKRARIISSDSGYEPQEEVRPSFGQTAFLFFRLSLNNGPEVLLLRNSFGLLSLPFTCHRDKTAVVGEGYSQYRGSQTLKFLLSRIGVQVNQYDEKKHSGLGDADEQGVSVGFSVGVTNTYPLRGPWNIKLSNQPYSIDWVSLAEISADKLGVKASWFSTMLVALKHVIQESKANQDHPEKLEPFVRSIDDCCRRLE